MINRHTLFLGDSLYLLKEIPEQSVDIVITDPPYFLDGLGDTWNKKALDKKKDRADVIGGLPVGMRFDPKQGHNFYAFYIKVAREIHRVLKAGGFFLSFSQPRLYHRMAVAVEDAGFEIRDQFAWHYTRGQMKAFTLEHFVDKMPITEKEKAHIKKSLNGRKTPQLRPQFESIVLAQKPKEGTFIENWLKYGVGLIDASIRLQGNTPSTVMHVDKPYKEEYNTHLTVKPVELIEHLLQVFSQEEQIVLDPFLGSGTTAIAAENTKRTCIGIELEEEYLKIAQKRLDSLKATYIIKTGKNIL